MITPVGAHLRLVCLGARMAEHDDFWITSGTSQSSRAENKVLAIEDDGLVPEGRPESNAIARLTNILFPDNTRTTYALIDPSLAFGLTSVLEQSDLFHRCLHRHPDDESFGSVYPWLVELKPDSAIFRKLCTSGMPRGWWDVEVNIFIRTTLTADRLWSHLRKYHRIPDEDGRWFLLRYWDPELLVGLNRISLPALTGLVLPEVQLVARWADRVAILSTEVTPPRLPIRLQPGDRSRIGAIRTSRRIRGIAGQLRSSFSAELDEMANSDLCRQVSEVLDVADDIGLHDGELRAKFVIMSVVTVPGMHVDRTIRNFLRTSENPDQRFRELDDVIRRRVPQSLKDGMN